MKRVCVSKTMQKSNELLEIYEFLEEHQSNLELLIEESKIALKDIENILKKLSKRLEELENDV